AQARTKTAAASAPAAKRPLNVLLIMSDDLSMRIGAFGDPVVKTPNIDRLARGAVRFEHAYTQYPQCAQSRASMLTGRRPTSTGVLDLKTSFRAALPNAVTMPQLFRNNGYFTGRVGKIFHQGVPGDIGTSGPDDAPSWMEVVNPRGRDKDVEDRLVSMTPGQPLGNSTTFLADDGPDAEQTDGKVADAAIRMLEQRKGRPFFIGVGFYRPHVPDVAPKAYFDLYPLDKIPVAPDTAEELAALPQVTARVLPAHFGMTPEQQRQAIRGYYASTSFMDAQLGRVLDAVARLGLADNTIIVFMSDHGYLLGEHGQWNKNSLWEQSLRTALFIRVPGAAGNGQAVRAPVELLDLYPTVAEVAGLAGPAELEGKSLAPLVEAPARTRWERPAFSEVDGGRSVRLGAWRYTEWQGGEMGTSLYDLASDPGERRNLADDPGQAARVARLSALLRREPVRKRDTYVWYDRQARTIRPATFGPKGTPASRSP
ncbi:MAG: sulfatase, partial [Phenylobacterium sp.]|uniref:sulfatase n=1 Tax=Phenylobacterium sp. TaxID=1871053 RepID=UPI001A51FD77